jgi:hypothetical protein
MPSEGATEPTLAYPDYLKHRDHLLGIVAIMTLMSGGTLLIVQIWEDATHQWPWRLLGTLVALRTIGTVVVLLVLSAVGVRIANMYTERGS